MIRILLYLALALTVALVPTFTMRNDEVRVHAWKVQMQETDLVLSFTRGLSELVVQNKTSLLENYLTILKARFKEQLILVNLGQIFPFHSTSDTVVRSGPELLKNKIYNFISLAAEDLRFLQEIQLDPSTFLSSNILDLKTGDLLTSKNILPYEIVEKVGMKIGFISLASPLTTTKKKIGLPKDLYLKDYMESILRVRKIFQKEQVDVTILMGNFSTHCLMVKDHKIYCSDPEDELFILTKRLPPGMIDLIITEGRAFIQGRLNGVNVVQMDDHHYFFYTTLKNKNGVLSLNSGVPVVLCQQASPVTGECLDYDYSVTDELRYPASFLGFPIK